MIGDYTPHSQGFMILKGNMEITGKKTKYRKWSKKKIGGKVNV